MQISEEITARFQALHEIVRAARDVLDENIWGYLIGGSETETTLRRNRLALDSLAFRPRVLENVSQVDPSADFFGRKVALPVLLAPIGALVTIHPDGGAATARAASAANLPLCISTVLDTTIEAAAGAAPGPKVLQIYARGDAAWLDDRIGSGIAAGYDAVCLTVDTSVPSRRERDIVTRYERTWRGQGEAKTHQASFNWNDFARIRAKHDVRLILKGIATAEDAGRACDEGADVVYVSNHGGRQLDFGRGTADVLPEVVDAVAGRARVYVDGGFCRGSDIVKARILGADMVGIGRLYAYGLAAAGGEGVLRVLDLLREEISVTLALLGVSRFSELDRSYLCPGRPVCRPDAHSAFPLLDLPSGPAGSAAIPPAG